MPQRTRECTALTLTQHNYLAQQTAAAKALHQLVTRKSHAHRHDRRRAVRLNDVLKIGGGRRVAVAVVEHSVVRLVDPLPQNHVKGLTVSE